MTILRYAPAAAKQVLTGKGKGKAGRRHLCRRQRAATTCLAFVQRVERQTGAPFPWEAYKKRGEFGEDDAVIQNVSPQKELAAQAGVPQPRIAEVLALLRANRDLLIKVIGGLPMSEAQAELGKQAAMPVRA